MSNDHRLPEVPGQLSITPAAVARHGDPDTSWAAAQSQTPAKLRESQKTVYRRLFRHGPMTDTDLVRVVAGLSPSGIRTRRRELVDLGLVVDTGDRVTLPSGRKSIVWAVV